MPLINEVSAAITDAMRKGDAPRLSALRMLKAALMNREVEKGRALDETEGTQVVAALVKQRRDSIEQFRAGGRQDLVDREQAEVVFLERYLPPAADPAMIAQAVDAAVTETGASGMKDMGKVMKTVMTKLAGLTVDGRAVSEIVKSRLTR